MATVGTLNIDLRMQTAAVVAGAAKVQSTIAGMAKSAIGSIKSISIVPTINVESIVGAFRSITTAQSKYIDDTGKLADRLGVATEAVVGFQHAADLAGVGADESASILEKFQKNLGGAAEDGGKLKDVVSELGLSINDLRDKGPVEAALQVADAMRRIPDATRRAGVAVELFGKSGQKLTNTLIAGKDGIRGAMQEAADLGMTFNRIDAAKVEAMNDAWTRVQGTIAGVGRAITIGVAPFVENIFNKIIGFMKENGKNFAGWIVDGFIAAVDAAQVLYAALLRVGSTLGDIMASIGLMMNQIGNSGLNKMMGLGDMRGAGMGVANAGNAMALRMRVAANDADRAPRWSQGIVSAANEAAKNAVQANQPDFADKVFGTLQQWTNRGKEIGKALGNGILDAAKAAKDKWQKIGESIKESVQTPLEKFQQKADEIEAARKGGYITDAIAARANLANQNSLEGSLNLPGAVSAPTAAEFGSSAAVNAIAQHQMQMSGGSGKSLPDLIKIAKEQQKDQERAADAATEQLNIWRNMKVVGI